MNALKTLAASAVLAVSATAGNAAVYYATDVIDANYGTCTAHHTDCNADDRKTTDNVKGAADGKFYSLGLGGDLTVGFGTTFPTASKVSAWEVTYSAKNGAPPKDNHREAVDVFAVLGMSETFIGTLYNYGTTTLNAWIPFEYIKLVDVTLREFDIANGGTTSFDGFDVDSISVAPVPLPAAGVLLLAGLGGLAAVRRRKTAA